MRRVALPVRIMEQGAEWAQHPLKSSDHAISAAVGLAKAFSNTFTSASETPFNVAIGPHRRFDWTSFEMEAVREVKRKFGGTINDVVLACVAGAARTHLLAHDMPVDDIDFRVMIPVSTRTEEQHGKLGNRVSLLVARLPVSERNARRRFESVVEETQDLKESSQVEGAEAMEELSDWTSTSLITESSRLAASRRAYNIVVTNVPGPPTPVYLAGSRMQASYPLVPLFENQGVGIALFSYGKHLHWGFNADWDGVPDLHDFVQAVDQEFEVLRKL
jgi:diacylglycerol O-acyltransferase